MNYSLFSPRVPILCDSSSKSHHDHRSSFKVQNLKLSDGYLALGEVNVTTLETEKQTLLS